MAANRTPIDAIVIGCSWGGLEVLLAIFKRLPKKFAPPLILVSHFPEGADSHLAEIIEAKCGCHAREVCDKDDVTANMIHIAPPGYHLLIESDRTFSLSVDERECFSRPSIDVLFMTAAQVYEKRLVGIVLSGNNHDGAQGSAAIKQHGGFTIVQDPASASAPLMPEAAIIACTPDLVLAPQDIGAFLNSNSENGR